MKSLKNYLIVLLVLVVAGTAFPGELSIGADAVSRYIWRGNGFRR